MIEALVQAVLVDRWDAGREVQGVAVWPLVAVWNRLRALAVKVCPVQRAYRLPSR